MKIKFCRIFTLVFLSFICLNCIHTSEAGYVKIRNYDDYSYVIFKNQKTKTVTIYNYTGTDKKIIIPSIINELPVTAINKNAFSKKQLISVVIPEGIEIIGDYAFSNNFLDEVILAKSVTSIGNYAFTNNNLTKLILHDNITYIGSNAFLKTN